MGKSIIMKSWGFITIYLKDARGMPNEIGHQIGKRYTATLNMLNKTFF